MTFWDGTQWLPENPRTASAKNVRFTRVTAWLATAAMVLVPVLVATQADSAHAGSARFVVSPSTVTIGTRFTAKGTGFVAGSSYALVLDTGKVLATVKANRRGAFSAKAKVPAAAPGQHRIDAVLSAAGGTGPAKDPTPLGFVVATVTLTIQQDAPEPTPAPTPTPDPAPESTPDPTATPDPAPESTPAPTPAPTATPEPKTTSAPASAASPTATATPVSTSTSAPITTPTPAPTAKPTPSPTASPAPTPQPTPAPETGVYYVTTTGSDTGLGSGSSPWKTIGKAVATAPSGSVIRIEGGTYASFAVTRSGLTIEAAAGHLVTVAGGTTAISITAADTTIRSLRVTGASVQGIRVADTSDITLSDLTVVDNQGHGITVIRTARAQVRESRILSNSMAGIRELDGTTAGRYTNNVIADNGRDGDPYNGDGIVLQGVGALVVGNTIVRNGDSDIYEHGIYASSVARDYRIESNTLRDNSASGIKASGSGRVVGNVVSGSVRGIVFADSGGSVVVTRNTVDATLYSILVTSNCDLARYVSEDNVFALERFGYLGQALTLTGWRAQTGLDLTSR